MTMDDPAAEAGVGRRTSYLHFKSKEEVALATIDRTIDLLLAELRKVAQSGGSRGSPRRCGCRLQPDRADQGKDDHPRSSVRTRGLPNKIKHYSLRGGTDEFKSRATEREWDRGCPSVRTACARSFLSISCGRSFWLVGAIWSKERLLGKFCSFRGVHGRGDVSLPQFIDSVVSVGSYRRGDTLWDIAYRRLQNTNGIRPLRSSPFVICYGHDHRSWHQDAIRLFGLLGSRCSILTGVLGA